MGIERVNGSFGFIMEMKIGWDKLVFYFPDVSNDLLELFTGFIVEDLEANELITVFRQVII